MIETGFMPDTTISTIEMHVISLGYVRQYCSTGRKVCYQI